MNSFTKKRKPAFMGKQFGIGLFTLCMTVLIAVSPQALQAQTTKTVSVNGRVFDAAGNPVSGIQIYDKAKTGIGTITDAKGEFSISNVPENGALVFSMIGYETQEVPVANKSFMNIVMLEDILAIEAAQVISTGYGGVVNKRNTTAATASINMDEIVDIPTFQLGEALVGMVPGLSVNVTSMRPGSESIDWGIRRTYTPGQAGAKDGGDASPLVVIDEIRTNTAALDNLDPSQIESIDILKDSEAAIYGSDGSQGVIIVKTKRGKVGRPQFSYSGFVGYNNNMTKFPEMMNSYEYGQYWNSILRSAVQTNENYYFSDDELEKMKNIHYDWLDKAWKPGLSTKHTLSMSGGTDKVTYNAAVGYNTKGENIGSFQNNDNWSYRTGMSAQIARGLSVDIQLSGTVSSITKQNAKDGDDYPVLFRMPTYIPWEVYDREGNAHYVARTINPTTALKDQAGNDSRSLQANNFFAKQDAGDVTENDSFSFRVSGSLTYQVPFIPGLTIKGMYSRGDNSSRGMEYRQTKTLMTPLGTNVKDKHLYTDIGVEDGLTYRETVYTKDNMVQYRFAKGWDWNTQLYLTYNRQFGDHSINATYSFDKSANENRDTQLRFENAIGGGVFGGTTGTSGDLVGENTVVNRSEGGDMAYAGRIYYGFKDRYFLTLIGRYDAHTKFSPENYWGFFPSIAGAWIVSDELFFKNNVRNVDFLKIRASYGKSGQKNVKEWEWLQTYDVRPNESGLFGTAEAISKGSGLKMGKSPNRDATWTKSYMLNVGVDVRLLKNRLSITFDQWKKRDREVLVVRNANLPISIGGSVAAENYGAVNSWGSEISVGWNQRVNRDFSYSINASWSIDNNKLITYERNVNAVYYPWTQREGLSTYFGKWGYKVWRGTSSGDGMIRTVEDAENYWAYLEANSAAYNQKYGTKLTPNFFGITKKEDFVKKLGMLVYEDTTSERLQNEDKTESYYNNQGDGRVLDNQDQVELSKPRAAQDITPRIRVTWKNFSLASSLTFSWGGFNSFDYGNLRQQTGSGNYTENMYRFMTDMYDAEYNTTGRWPNANHRSYNEKASDFWRQNSFSLMVRNLTLSYSLPREFANRIGFQSMRFSLTGNNIGYIIDPLRKFNIGTGYSLTTNYPILRTWALAVNITFK